MYLWLCARAAQVRLMRCDCILPSAMVFLWVMVKVNLSTREGVHGWQWKGHISPACPIWFSGLCSTFHLLFLPNLCTWGWGKEGKEERKFVLVRLSLFISLKSHKRGLYATDPNTNTHTHTHFKGINLSACTMWTFSKQSPPRIRYFSFLWPDSTLGLFPRFWHFLKRHQNLQSTI